MSETGAPGMTWEEARTLLKTKPGARVSSLSWEQAGKFIFRARAWVQVPGREPLPAEKEAGLSPDVETLPALWFSNREGLISAYKGSSEGEERDDWIEGPSPGKPDAA
ncbi:hypothetical protein ACFVXC_05610 [Streptomyces sp. NPDC058257]|uniref:hypothetical protein n=1 Tax=Streptomyces sp. NPDC058257 TaxID=3346409 RepID=UPI0036EFC497